MAGTVERGLGHDRVGVGVDDRDHDAAVVRIDAGRLGRRIVGPQLRTVRPLLPTVNSSPTRPVKVPFVAGTPPTIPSPCTDRPA